MDVLELERLLVQEKTVTHARDALAAERRRMPWMAVEKKYEFDGANGKVSLLDMGNVTEVSPAFGATLGLPVGDAGVKFGVQFSANGLSTFAAIVLDDNGMTTGGGTVTLTGLGSFDGEAAIVDCATEPVP